MASEVEEVHGAEAECCHLRGYVWCLWEPGYRRNAPLSTSLITDVQQSLEKSSQ